MELAESPEVKEILRRYREVWAIDHALSLMSWDMETYMPEAGFRERGEARAVLRRMIQRILTSQEFKSLVWRAEPQNDFEKGVIRVLKRKIERYEKLPPEFIEEEAKATTAAYSVWVKAKEKSDYKLFSPHLSRVFDLAKRKAELLGYEKHPYDPLLDWFEEGLTVADCEKLFSITGELSELFKKASEKYPQKHPLEEEKYSEQRMRELNMKVLKAMGFDFKRGRIDVSPHPFTSGIGLDDVRITTWYHGRDFRRSLFAALHEFGHAAYDMNIDRALWLTPVQGGASLGVHESQSLFWENIVGRSMAFVEAFQRDMVEHLPFLREYTAEDVYRYFTLVRPELIRVEADEVQYVLHVYLRYKIEKDMLEERLDVSELPQVWDELMEKLIGVKPESHRDGVLQDVHWSQGYIGYFPTYAIGRVLAAQVALLIKELEEKVREKRFSEIMGFLREKVHRWGAVYPPRELVKRALGEELTPPKLLEYLKLKYLS
ncbi:MAG: carboxypeptidase M32 [Thermoproteota archaeon]|nr:MAG: carboxypeptidase M32 [Candidatus Korarchaeota archaeon]